MSPSLWTPKERQHVSRAVPLAVAASREAVSDAGIEPKRMSREQLRTIGVRLEKKMESTDAQPFMRGDILALQFANATEEAEWIAKKLEWLLGAEYQDRADKPKRGLAFSDMAILVRAWKDAGPIVEALRKAEVPYLGGGMNSLLDTPEAEAIREVFYFLAGHIPRGRAAISEASLRKSLADGFPGLTSEDINSGTKFLRGILKRIPLGSDNQLFLQRVYLDLLEAMAVREDRIDRRGEPGRSFFSISGSSAN